jgi:hypothetical protein
MNRFGFFCAGMLFIGMVGAAAILSIDVRKYTLNAAALKKAAAEYDAQCEAVRAANARLAEVQAADKIKLREAFDRIDVLQRELAAGPQIVEVEVIKPTARVLDLPEDGDQWYTTLFLHPKWDELPDPKLRAAQANAVKMFNTEPWCLELRQQTHWNVITIDDARAKPFYPIIPRTPCLMIQRACGEVIYKESGANLSEGPHGLRRAIQKATKRHCPDGRCPVAWPVPKKEDPPKAEVPAVIEKTPDAPKVPDAPKPKGVSPVTCAVVVILAFGTTVAIAKSGLFAAKVLKSAGGG